MDIQELDRICSISQMYLTKEPFCVICVNISSHLFFYLDFLQALQVRDFQIKAIILCTVFSCPPLFPVSEMSPSGV